MIDLHSNKTPNSQKVAILLEEVGFDYRLMHYDIFIGEHFTPEYRALNPNNKLPTMVDNDPVGGGEPIVVFETGAILVYLADKAGRFLPADIRARSATLQWLIWQVAGLGPMHGQAHHFIRFAPSGEDYGVNRYLSEAKRLLSVMEFRLRQAPYLAGDYSIADMACWPFVTISDKIDIELSAYPAVQRWHDNIKGRSAVQRVLTNPDIAIPSAQVGKRMALSADQWSHVFGDRMLAASSPD